MATNSENTPARRLEDHHPDAKIDWSKPGAPAVPLSSTAGAALSDEDIRVIWQTMPGGPAGWLRSFGYLQFARAIEDAVTQRHSNAKGERNGQDSD